MVTSKLTYAISFVKRHSLACIIQLKSIVMMMTMIVIFVLISCYSIESLRIIPSNAKNQLILTKIKKLNANYNTDLFRNVINNMKLSAKSDRKITREDEGEYFESEVSFIQSINLIIYNNHHIMTSSSNSSSTYVHPP